jgi:glutamate N-acetyltransferase/amino-acid N-acetyltransferase
MRKLLSKAVDQSFNRITVDGDTSTNDTVYFLASGIKEVKDGNDFAENLISLAKELAYLIVKDGEGATKVIRVEIKGARNKEEARALAMSIANSPLVKTAFYGADPNWGRILSALGKTGIDFDPQLVQIFLNGKPWVKELSVQTKEEDLRKEMQKSEVSLVVHLKLGKVSYEVLTCDLTEDYIRINASYRS